MNTITCIILLTNYNICIIITIKMEQEARPVITSGELVRTIGIPHNRLNYLVLRGYVSPIRETSGTRERWLFTNEEVDRIKRLWELIEEGYRVGAAFRKISTSGASFQQAAAA